MRGAVSRALAGVEALLVEESDDLRLALLDPVLQRDQIVGGLGEDDRPQREVRRHFALGESLDRHVAVGGTGDQEAVADEPAAGGEADRDQERGNQVGASVAVSHVDGSSLRRATDQRRRQQY